MYPQLGEVGPKLREYWEAWPSGGALAFALLFWASPDKPFHTTRRGGFRASMMDTRDAPTHESLEPHTLARCTRGYPFISFGVSEVVGSSGPEPESESGRRRCKL